MDGTNMAFIENGVTRHALSNRKLTQLYWALDEYRADCSESEYAENQDAFIKIFTLIHQHQSEGRI